MNKNYPGSRKPIARLQNCSYLKNSEYDLPQSTAALLIKNKFAVETCAPWEKNTNRPMVELERLKKIVSKISGQISVNVIAINKAQAIADTIPQYEKTIIALQAELKGAQKARDDFAAKNKISLEKKTDGKEEKPDGAEAGSKSEGDNTNAAGQAASAEQGEQ